MQILRTLFLTLLILLPVSANAARLAVLDIVDPEFEQKVLVQLSAGLRDGALGVVRNSDVDITVITRENMLVNLIDNGVDPSCIEDASCEVETARRIGADFVITSTLLKLEGTWILSSNLHDSNTTDLLWTETVEANGLLELTRATPGVARALLAKGLGLYPASPEVEIPENNVVATGITVSATAAGVVAATRTWDRGESIDNTRTTEKGYIYVTAHAVDGADAAIYINGELCGHGQCQSSPKDLGKYIVSAELGLYHAKTQVINLVGEETKEVSLELEVAHGTLQVTSPQRGAMVFINNERVGSVPVSLSRKPSGFYQVRVSGDDHFDFAGTAEVKDGEVTVLNADLLPSVGGLHVSSSPSGATVYLNGQRVDGVTPLVISGKPEGDYQLVLKRKDYFEHQMSVQIANGVNSKVSVSLVRSVASVRITSNPPGAKLYINQEHMGTTPWESNSLQPGERLVRLDLNLYKSVEKVKTLSAGDDVEWLFELPVNHGSIAVTSQPKGVPITLDNKPSGHSTPHTFTQLRAGTHEIELSKLGYGVQRQRVEVAPGTTASSEFNLDARVGTISISSTTADGTPCRGLVYVDNESTGKRTPLRKKEVAIDHTIKVDCDGRVGVRKVKVLHNAEIEVPIVVESFTKQHLADARKALAKSRTIDRIGFSAGGAAVAVTGWSAWTSYVAQTDANAITSSSAGHQYQILLDRRNTFATTAVAASVVGTSMLTAAIFHRLRVTSKRKKRVEYVEDMID